MSNQFARTELIIGEGGVAKLADASVIVIGIGGVGSYVVEGLARAGVGRLTLVDNDVIDVTNINRQLPALHSTVGKSKAEVMASRVRDINPQCEINAVECFFMPDTAGDFDFSEYDYVIDAIDNVKGKIAIAEKAYSENVPLISSMGTGNKLDPTAFKIAYIEDTKVCPLAKVMRKELKVRGIKGIKVLYSEEEPIKPQQVAANIDNVAKTAGDNDAYIENATDNDADIENALDNIAKTALDNDTLTTRRSPGSISFVPSVAGLVIAGTVVKDIIGS